MGFPVPDDMFRAEGAVHGVLKGIGPLSGSDQRFVVIVIGKAAKPVIDCLGDLIVVLLPSLAAGIDDFGKVTPCVRIIVCGPVMALFRFYCSIFFSRNKLFFLARLQKSINERFEKL